MTGPSQHHLSSFYYNVCSGVRTRVFFLQSLNERLELKGANNINRPEVIAVDDVSGLSGRKVIHSRRNTEGYPEDVVGANITIRYSYF